MIWSIIGILRESFRMSFDGIPSSIDIKKIEELISSTNGVTSFHHLHIWALSTTQNALTIHIVIGSESDTDILKKEIRHLLSHQNIQHSTIEIEYSECENRDC